MVDLQGRSGRVALPRTKLVLAMAIGLAARKPALTMGVVRRSADDMMNLCGMSFELWRDAIELLDMGANGVKVLMGVMWLENNLGECSEVGLKG